MLLAFRNDDGRVLATSCRSQSILAVAYTVIGGIGFVLGAPFGSQLVQGGFGTWLLDVFFDDPNPTWLVVIGGITVIVLIVLHPDGAISVNVELIHKLRHWFLGKLGRLKDEAPPALPEVPREEVAPATLAVDGVTVRFGGVTAVQRRLARGAPRRGRRADRPERRRQDDADRRDHGLRPSDDGRRAPQRRAALVDGPSTAGRARASAARSSSSSCSRAAPCART